MKLGIMVTTERHLDQVCGLTAAALRRGGTVSLFATDAGVRLLAQPRFVALAGLAGVALSFCLHSAREHGGPPPGLPETVVAGSQFENALLVAGSDRVLVL